MTKEYDDIAKLLMDNHTFKTPEDSEICYVFLNGYYIPAEILIKKECQAMMDESGDKLSARFVREVIETIKRRTYITKEEAERDKNLISLKNGIFDIKNFILIPPNKDFFVTYQIPVNYDPTKKCPSIDKFLSEIVSKEDIKTLIDIPAYCLMKSNLFKIFFIFVGEHDTGKSTYCDLLTAFLNKENVSAIPIQDIGQRFRSTGLIDKLANIVPDLPTKAIKEVGMVKALTGNTDLIGAEIKNGKSFEFVNTAKLIFSCNELPRVSYDTDEAFYQRIKFIQFPNKFDESNMDRELNKKLTTDDELSGFLNLVLDNLFEMDFDKAFSPRDTADENRQFWERMMDGNSVTMFLDSSRVKKGGWVEKKEFFLEYVAWCKTNNEVSIGESKLGREMRNRHKYQDFYPKSAVKADQQVHAWKGIHIQ